jgi:hypothetical protein
VKQRKDAEGGHLSTRYTGAVGSDARKPSGERVIHDENAVMFSDRQEKSIYA